MNENQPKHVDSIINASEIIYANIYSVLIFNFSLLLGETENIVMK